MRMKLLAITIFSLQATSRMKRVRVALKKSNKKTQLPITRKEEYCKIISKIFIMIEKTQPKLAMS